MKITKEQMQSLEDCQSADEWRKACHAIKSASESGICYPDDWWDKVVQSGLMDRVTARWGASSEISVTIHDTLPVTPFDVLGAALDQLWNERGSPQTK